MHDPRSANALADDAARCPVSHVDHRIGGPVLSHYALLENEREGAPVWRNDGSERPFWMITRYDDVLDALQRPELLSNRISNVLSPNRPVKFQPNNLDGAEHTRLRRALNRWFSPAAVRRIEPRVVDRARQLVAELAGRGECDLVQDFALRYATDLFLASLGLPIEDGKQFVQWVDVLFADLYTGPRAEAAMASITGYFSEAISAREAGPVATEDPQHDFLGYLLHSDVADEQLSRDDLLIVCLSLMVAGLDTTRSALGYAFHHLATHPEDRARLINDPDSIPQTVEELVRLYSLVLHAGRVVTEDAELDGMDLKAGDLVWIGIASANRDPRRFDDPDRFDPERESLGRHLGFGAGPHRCLGMHLARHELAIALREWHAVVPDYEIATSEPIQERGAQLSLASLPLRWTVTPEPTDHPIPA